MAKQKVTIEVDVPEGWVASGHYRQPCAGEFILTDRGNVVECSEGGDMVAGIIVEKPRPKEPLAIQACRTIVDCNWRVYRDRELAQDKAFIYAQNAIAEFESGEGKR